MTDSTDDLGHPDSAVRLASCVHRFRVPRMPDTRLSKSLSYAKSFNTTGQYPKTRQTMLKADTCRSNLMEALQSKYVSHARVVQEAKRYIPLVHQVLLSCKIQPEGARLDERLVFEWLSGIESDPQPYSSEAIMYEMVMSVICEGLGRAGAATESSVAGEFASASRDYAGAAGIFYHLANDLLPKWIAKGSNVKEETLPSECSVAMASALQQLFQVNGQQMAVATVLVKPGTPNYSLLGKLSFGIVQQLEAFMSHMRKDCKIGMDRMDKDFFSLVAFQIAVHKSLSDYFHARGMWAKSEYGVAIAMLKDALASLKMRDGPTGAGIPDVSKIATLSVLNKDLQDFRGHIQKLLKTWEHDNNSVYFERVPVKVPAEAKIQEGVVMAKREDYKVEDVEPVLLQIPSEKGNILSSLKFGIASKPRGLERSDSDVARELQAKLNNLHH